jgi:hypothetical protein
MTNEGDASAPQRSLGDDVGLPQAAVASGGIAFEGSAEFARVLYAAMGHAGERATRQLCWCDEDFGAWPLGESDWIAQLTRWSRVSGRELVMIARDWNVIERRHPRFAAWRRDWAHVVRCLVPEETRTQALPTLWIDSDDQAVRVFDPEYWRGRAGFDRVDRQRAREDFDAIAQRASPGFAAVTLGL